MATMEWVHRDLSSMDLGSMDRGSMDRGSMDLIVMYLKVYCKTQFKLWYKFQALMEVSFKSRGPVGFHARLFWHGPILHSTSIYNTYLNGP